MDDPCIMDEREFQVQLERAVTWAGIWSPGQKCEDHAGSGYYCEHHYLTPHDIPCPPMTDELAMILLHELVRHHVTFRLEHFGSSKSVFITLYNDTQYSFTIDNDDPARAIVLAVAALAESAKE